MTNSVAYRRAEITDIAVIMTIRLAVRENVLSNPSRVTPKMCEDYLDLLGRGWVAEIENTVVGFSYADNCDSLIWALFVLPEYEGRGIGKGLLKLAVHWPLGLGNDSVKLGTAANTRADRFYAAQGWTRGNMKNDIEVEYTLLRPEA